MGSMGLFVSQMVVKTESKAAAKTRVSLKRSFVPKNSALGPTKRSNKNLFQGKKHFLDTLQLFFNKKEN